jgi:hypothetical protein
MANERWPDEETTTMTTRRTTILLGVGAALLGSTALAAASHTTTTPHLPAMQAPSCQDDPWNCQAMLSALYSAQVCAADLKATTETPEQRRADARAQAQADAQATAQAHAQAAQAQAAATQAARVAPTQTAQARLGAAHSQATAQAQAHAQATAAAVATHDALPTATPLPLTVEAQTLVQQYDANKLAAQQRYTGRVVQTTARITDITSSFGQPYLVLEPASEASFTLTSIMCNVDKEDTLLSLSKGQQVTVRGTVSDMFMTTIPLDHCTLVR